MRSALLETLPPAVRASVLEVCRPRSFARREVVFREGDPADGLHLLTEGRVAVRSSTKDGQTATLSILGRDSAFGELALVRPARLRTGTVVALEAAHTLLLPAAVFADLRERNPGVDRLLVSVLAARVERLSDQVLEALYVPVERRLLRWLSALLRQYASGGSPLTIPLTQDDLAGLAGTTRPTVNQILRGLEEAGVLALRRGAVDVLDPSRLRQLAR